MVPSEYYTIERLKERFINDPPKYLFYFCDANEMFTRSGNRSNGFMQSLYGVRVTENPVRDLYQGNFVFVFDSDCVLDFGFTIYPFTYNSAPELAEWRIIDGRNAVYLENPFAPVVRYGKPTSLKNIPFSCIAMMGVKHRIRIHAKKLLSEVVRCVEGVGFTLDDFNWKDWWTEDGPIRRSRDA